MNRRPQFKRCFHYEVVPSEGVFLLSEKGHFLLRGPAYIRLAPLLDGQLTEEEIVERLQKHLSAAEVFYAIEMLRRQGYVVDATPSLPSEQAAFWDLLDVDPEVAVRRLQETTVSVVSFGRIDPAPFLALLTTLGIRVDQDGKRAIALTDDYLQPGLDAFNQATLAHNRPWLLVKPVGTELWLGPLFIPGQTGCWACLAHRLRGSRKVESYLANKKNISGLFPIALSVLPSTLQTAFGLAATEVAKWIICGRNETFAGRVITLNMLSLEKDCHILVRRPQCRCCGNPDVFAANQTAPLVLQHQPKSFTSDGGHRFLSPQETIERLSHHISPITGIVSALQRVSVEEDKNGPVSIYVTDHNFALMDDELYFRNESWRGRSAGKGKQDVQAKASALGESIERYSGMFQGDEARIWATFKNLGAAIHPNLCMLFSQRQIEQREQWNEKGSRFYWVPQSFDEELEIEWSPVWSLTGDQFRYVPTAYCYFGYSRKFSIEFTRADANGCAAGNSKEEAILQGFLELVERDSVAMWWYNRLKRPAVNLFTFDEPYFQELSSYYHSLNRDFWVLDITSDLNIPAFAAISRRNDRAQEDIILGFGAHLDPQIALLRATTELNQLLPAVFAGTHNQYSHDRQPVEWWTTATIENQPYLTPNKTEAPKCRVDYPQLGSDDLYQDVLTCVQIAQAKGLETLVLDQTRPDTGLSVVKVIVPGLRHFWARFGPGRLYDVPVQMGWLAEPLAEEELNPIPIFL